MACRPHRHEREAAGQQNESATRRVCSCAHARKVAGRPSIPRILTQTSGTCQGRHRRPSLRSQWSSPTPMWLKDEAYTAVDVAAVERCPRIDGPPAVDTARRPQEWLGTLPEITRQVRAPAVWCGESRPRSSRANASSRLGVALVRAAGGPSIDGDCCSSFASDDYYHI